MRGLRITLITIGIFQLFFGVVFLVAPSATASLLGLRPAAPAWANWLFAMMAGRFLGYAFGMFAAARKPETAQAWIGTMIVIQAIDWLATIGYLATGHLALAQVPTAAIMPVLFIAGLLWFWPRGASRSESPDPGPVPAGRR